MSQWIADMHLPADPVEIATTAGFSSFGSTRPVHTMADSHTHIERRAESKVDEVWRKVMKRSSIHDVVDHSQTHTPKRGRGGDAIFDQLSKYRRNRVVVTQQTSVGSSSVLHDDCLNPFASNILADFTVRRASVEQDLYSLTNPLGLVHPAYELHHFAISGVYSATNTFFVEFVVERIS